MKKKIKISNEFIIPDKVLAISTRLNDYRIAWDFNNKFGFNLSKIQTDYIIRAKEEDNIDIILYSYKNESGFYFYLLKNIYEGIILIPKLINIDYVLIIEDDTIDLKRFTKEFASLTSIIGTFIINLNPSQTNFLKKLLLK